MGCMTCIKVHLLYIHISSLHINQTSYYLTTVPQSQLYPALSPILLPRQFQIYSIFDVIALYQFITSDSSLFIHQSSVSTGILKMYSGSAIWLKNNKYSEPLK